MNSQETFKKNIERWAVTFPDDAKALQGVACKRMAFCTANNGMPNLQWEVDGTTHYLHSQHDPVDELFQWLSTLNLLDVKTVVVYGVGLGYAYDILKSWLKADPQRSLVFIEDDKEVLRCLFEIDRGTVLLQDEQVWIFLIEDPRTSSDKFQMIGHRFGQGKYKLTGLCSYLENKVETMMRLNEIVEYLMNMQYIVNSELREFSRGFYGNFYYNVFDIVGSYDAAAMGGKFKGIPAIICGAGPSLKKNIDVLRTLHDKALIFGGGTAMNALNNAGILPHFGIGIDPNADQVLRLITNTAYDTPYFYHRRLNTFALQAIHGDHIYVSSGFSYPLSDRIDKELGLDPKNLNEGYNVINFSLAIAHALGCNPIITVGVDLAYSGDASYSTLSDPHPIYANKQAYRTKGVDEELIPRNDIYGKPILTLWKWMIESMWYSNFILENPDIELVNATEGGIGFPGVPNMTLKEAAEKYMPCCFDLDALIHGELQNAKVPATVTDAKIRGALDDVDESLKRSAALCEKIKNAFEALAQQGREGKPLPKILETDEISEDIEELYSESSYNDILRQFDVHCLTQFFKEIDKLDLKEHEKGDNSSQIRKAEINIERYNLLYHGAQMNQAMLSTAEKNYREYLLKEKHTVEARKAKDENVGAGVYTFENGALSIVDSSLGINIHEDAVEKSRYHSSLLYYPSGVKKFEAHFLDHALHGYVKFFSEEGALLSENWYCKGVRQGRAVTRFKDGSLCGIKRYLDGDLHGEQVTFYRNGSIKTVLNYSNGKYDGKILLYFPNGQMKRSLNFSDGLIDGMENVWNIDGKIIIEANYSKGHAVGITRYWNPHSGQLLKQVTFDKKGEIVDVKAWDNEGVLIDLEASKGKDYFDTMVKEANKLTHSIDQIFLQLQSVIPTLKAEINSAADNPDELNTALDEIKQQLDGLKHIGKLLSIESGMDPNSSEEPIWKSPSMQAIMQERLNLAAPMIESGILNIQTALCKTLIALEDRNKQNKADGQ